METKKNENVDLSHKKPLFFNIGLCLSLTLVLGAFSIQTPELLKPIDLEEINVEQSVMEDIPLTKQEVTPVRPVLVQPDIIEVKNDKKVEKIDLVMPEDTTLKQDNRTFKENAKYTPPVETQTPTKIIEEPTDEPLVFVADGEKADFIGGYKAFQKFIQDNYEYPRIARRTHAQGTINVQFVVEKDGTITDIKILRGVSVECDAEAIKVLKKVPKWKPAKQRGRYVRNRIVLPIKLKLD